MYDSVGAMYVKVLADTSGLKNDIEKNGGAAGAKSADAFDRSFQRRLSKNLTKGQVFGALDKRVEKWARDMATTIGDAVDFDTIKFDLSDIISDAEIRKIANKLRVPATEVADYLARSMSGALLAAQREQEKSLKKYQSMKEAADAEDRRRIKALADFDSAQKAKALQDSLDETERIIRETYRELTDENDRFLDTFGRKWRVAFTNVDRLGKKVGTLRASLRRAGTGGWFDSLTNVLGGILGLSFQIGKVVPATFRVVGKWVSSLGTRFAGMNGVIGQIGSQFVQLGGILGKFGKGGPAAIAAIAVALGIVQAALGSIVVLVNTLTAGVVALGSALFYAVSNAALLVPLMGALGVGLAGAAIGAIDATQAVGKLWTAINETDPEKQAAAWKEYNRELKRLGPNAAAAVEALRPLVKQFTGLKKAAGEELFEGMADALKKAQPLVDAVKNGLTGVANAVGDVVKQFLGLAQNTTFMASFNTMWKTSATIIRDLGSVAANLFAGFTNFFAAISPLVTQFSGGLATAAENFRKWTETESGRQAILDFFTDAYNIGKQVWDVIKELGLALFDLFTADATKGAAQDLFGFLLGEVRKFRDWINEISENGKLQEWFDDAKEVGKLLWDVIKDIGKALAGLNTDQNKEIFKDLLFLLKTSIATFRVFAAVGSGAMYALLAPIRLVRLAIDGITTAIRKAIDWWRRLRGQETPSAGGGGGSFRAAPSGRALTLAAVGPTAAPVVNNWNITTPGMDSRVVASQVMNRMAAMAG